MSSRAHSTTDRRQHHQRASAHACPECGVDPLIIIFTAPASNENATYWFDCPHCTFDSALRTVPPTEDEPTRQAPLAQENLNEYVAAIDVEPPF
jgi:predicted RNA-binding Zn-ribbon protein involved in translation (DUF1610 family)